MCGLALLCSEFLPHSDHCAGSTHLPGTLQRPSDALSEPGSSGAADDVTRQNSLFSFQARIPFSSPETHDW